MSQNNDAYVNTFNAYTHLVVLLVNISYSESEDVG